MAEAGQPEVDGALEHFRQSRSVVRNFDWETALDEFACIPPSNDVYEANNLGSGREILFDMRKLILLLDSRLDLLSDWTVFQGRL
jgi:hypothetical protein